MSETTTPHLEEEQEGDVTVKREDTIAHDLKLENPFEGPNAWNPFAGCFFPWENVEDDEDDHVVGDVKDDIVNFLPSETQEKAGQQPPAFEIEEMDDEDELEFWEAGYEGKSRFAASDEGHFFSELADNFATLLNDPGFLDFKQD